MSKSKEKEGKAKQKVVYTHAAVEDGGNDQGGQWQRRKREGNCWTGKNHLREVRLTQSNRGRRSKE